MKQKPVNTSPAGWRDRAIAMGWTRNDHRLGELNAFEEGLPPDVVAVLVEPNVLSAWYRVTWTIVTTQQYLLKTTVRYIPPAESRQAETLEDAKPWCPSHAFACGATKELRCGYNCDGTKSCMCGSCLNYASYGVPLDKRVELKWYPPPKHGRKPKIEAVATRPVRTKKIKAPKVEKPKKPKDHLLPGQVGLFGGPR